MKWTRKYNDMMDCFNGEMYDDGKCLKSPALDDYSYQIPQMTKEDCSTTCQVLQTTFYGVENGQNCSCGNILKSTEPGTCNIACVGDLSELDCGGTDSTLISTVQKQGNCFSNASQVLTGPSITIPNNDHIKCSNQCSVQGYAFFGLQETNCICGNFLRSAQPGTCDTACQGDLTENCGGKYAILVLPVNPSVQSLVGLCTPCNVAIKAQNIACKFFPHSVPCKAAHGACEIACIPFFCPSCPAV